MVATDALVDLGSPAEFAPDADQCVLEQTAVFEIFHQGGQGLVEHRMIFTLSVEDRPV